MTSKWSKPTTQILQISRRICLQQVLSVTCYYVVFETDIFYSSSWKVNQDRWYWGSLPRTCRICENGERLGLNWIWFRMIKTTKFSWIFKKVVCQIVFIQMYYIILDAIAGKKSYRKWYNFRMMLKKLKWILNSWLVTLLNLWIQKWNMLSLTIQALLKELSNCDPALHRYCVSNL